jgi:hypothetical protein
MSCKKVELEDFCEQERYDSRLPNGRWNEKFTRSVPHIWGCVYDVHPLSTIGTRKRDEKSDSPAAKKGLRK